MKENSLFENWIRQQNDKIQIEVFNRFSHHLNNNELVSVMNAVQSGRNIVDIHLELGLFEKYRTDLFRIRQIVTERWPDIVFN